MDFKSIELLFATWLLKLGPRLTKSNLEYAILQGSHFFRRERQRVLQRCSRWLDLVPRWAGLRLLFAFDDAGAATCENVRFLKEIGPSGRR